MVVVAIEKRLHILCDSWVKIGSIMSPFLYLAVFLLKNAKSTVMGTVEQLVRLEIFKNILELGSNPSLTAIYSIESML